MIDTLVLFGAAGDLASRLVLPAVEVLRSSGAPVRVVGADARSGAHAGAGVDVLRRADVTSPDEVAAVLDLARSLADPGPLAVYLALPTQLMLPAVRAVAAYGLPPGSRVAIEKPFGHDGVSAAELNAACAALPDVYRVDHFLAMTGVQQLAERAGGWSSKNVSRFDLLFDETLALEGRASFYDRAGALRDVMQNHLLAVLGTLAASPGPDIAQARANVLRSVLPVDVATTRRARYNGYLDEPGVDPAHGTETFAEVSLMLDTPRWAGIPFVLRAGKALAERRRGVVVHPRPGALVEPAWLDFDLPEPDGTAAEPRAYQRIVADVLAGGDEFAIGAGEAQESWRIFDPVLAAWSAGVVPLRTYPHGTNPQ